MKMQQKLSPQQLLLMRLLQLPVTELEQRLKEEVEKNPMLEVNTEGGDMVESLPESSIEDSGADEGIDTEDDDYSYRERQERDKNQDAHERVFIAEATFGDHLLEQLSMRNLTPRQQTIAEEIVGSLDDAGYVGRDIELIANDLAFTRGIEVSPHEVEEVLFEVQRLDPPGIAARNLQECLSLQLHRISKPDQAAQWAIQLIDQCFDQFVKHNYDRIMETLSLTEDQLDEAIGCIRRLNPKPGAGESESEHAHYVIPDFIVTNHEGQLSLMLNDGHLPQLQLNDYYQEMLQEYAQKKQLSPSEKEAYEFLRTNSDSANELVDTLKQRHVTMLRVMQTILRWQHKFFVTGDSADLRPLLQKDVAEKTGYDISTVSRVVNSKYVQTEFGTFLLKECFSQAITNGEGQEVATETVRQVLQAAVDAEAKRNPLSDEALSQLLKDQGYPVARRTVAKYREMLGIPVCRLRRQLKMIALLMLLSLSGSVFAQQPRHESYYDSLINARIREGQVKSRMGNSVRDGQKDKNRNADARQRGALEIHEPEPDPNAIDTALALGDELIDVMYDASLPAPSQLWYGRNLSGAHVRMATIPMDSLPDEISIQLLKGQERFCFPVKNIKTSPYGWRWNRPHRGVDIRLNVGDPVHCAFNGVVRIARPMGAYGNLVVVRHYNGLETVYGHLSKIKVKPLQVVSAGQVLGLGGSTGRSTGPHLHFEVRFQYEAFDPEWILDFNDYTLRTRRLYLDKTYFGIRKPRNADDLVYKADKSIVPEEQPKLKSNKPLYATIKHGEDLEAFAKRNFTTTDKVKDLNPDERRFRSGTRLRVR